MATTTTKDDGGPAFPMQNGDAIHAKAIAEVAHLQGETQERAYMQARAAVIGGMSLRDYFAARAPEAPEWFNKTWQAHRVVPLPLSVLQAVQDPRVQALPKTKRDALSAWLHDGTYEPDDDIEALAKELRFTIDKRQEQHEAALIEHEIARFFSWRWYYADEMVKARRV